MEVDAPRVYAVSGSYRHLFLIPRSASSDPSCLAAARTGYCEAMSNRLSPAHRLATAASWPLGIGLTSWHYMWRTTPMHRSERAGCPDDRPPPLPAALDHDDVQLPEDGVGPLFHRVYRARIRNAELSATDVIARIEDDPNCVSPTEFARFLKADERTGRLGADDEVVVRMPGPWDGPVRVVSATPAALRLVTLAGHLEAGQIEFRARDEEGMVVFEIESWARSGDRLSNLLYHHLRMAKEIQLHMWSSVLEKVARLAGGRLTGGIEITTRRLEAEDAVA
jgi:hypothetical protein